MIGAPGGPEATRTTPPRTVEVFADVLCPFTHVGLRRLVERRADLGRSDPRLVVRAWPLELVNGAPLATEEIATEVAILRSTVAPELFAAFDPTTFPSTSLPALTLAARARRAGHDVGERCSLALRDALFEEGRDISDPGELALIAADLGLGSPDEEDQASVCADLRRGRLLGVVGSPHFFVDGDAFFCPGLEIRHLDGVLQVDVNPVGFAALAARCFGESEG